MDIIGPRICLKAVDLTQYHAHNNDKHHKFGCRYCRNSFSLQAELDKHVNKEYPPRQEDDQVDPAQPSTSAGVSSQSVQTSQASTETNVNPAEHSQRQYSTTPGDEVKTVYCLWHVFGGWEYYMDHINRYHFKLLVTCKFCKDTRFCSHPI